MVSAGISFSSQPAGHDWSNPFQAADHYVLTKVGRQLLPYLVASPRVKWQPFVVVSQGYAYLGDIAAALAGLGIGAPFIGAAQNGLSEGVNLADVFGSGPWAWLGILGVIAWIFIRLYVQREDVNARATAARAFVVAMNSLAFELHTALDEREPMPRIIDIQKRINAKVQEAMDGQIWPFQPLPDDMRHRRDLFNRIDGIRRRQMPDWADAPAQERANV